MVGLAIAIALVAAIWSVGVLGMPPRAPPARAASSAARFAHTLIPIAAAYLVAHYFSLLAYNGQDAVAAGLDPLGDGSDLFGGAGGAIDYSIVSARPASGTSRSARS